jgi:predicted metal-dependent enzyme (double-stranded beta helix superfamily)
MFDLDRFIEDCKSAVLRDSTHKSVLEIVERAMGEPSSIVGRIGEPQRAQSQKLYHSPTLTVLNVIWGPHMTFLPHNHQMWGVVGIYTGREDNILWRKLPGGQVEAAGARSLGVGDAEPLGRDIIHSVTNPLARMTGAIHVYGGDFYTAERSQWDPETLLEEPFDFEASARRFEESNRDFR